MEYIYPKGQTGRILGAMVEYVNGESPKFIDDAIANCGILDYQEDILKSGAKVLLAWDKKSGENDSTMQKLTLKLRQLGIPYNENAFYEYSLMVVKKLKEQASKKGAKYIVGIELGGLGGDKHIGILDDELVKIYKNELLLIYLCGFYESYKRIKQKILKNNLNAIAAPLHYYDFDLVDFVDIMCRTSWTQKNAKVKTIEIGHGMVDRYNYNLDEYFNCFDFYCVPSKSFAPKTTPKKVKLIKSGYLAFDKTYAKLTQANNSNLQHSCAGGGLLFDAYNDDELQRMLPYINVALKKYKIRFRARFFTQGNSWQEKSRKILESLQKTSNFIIDDSWKTSLESYKESFLFCCGITSAKNTFPLLTLCPSLVLFGKEINKNLGISLSDETSPEAFLEVVEKIDSTRKVWKKRILDYRENDVYNFGNASAYLAQFITNLLKEKYETR